MRNCGTPNSHQPNTEVSDLTYTSSFPSKPPLMLSTIVKNKGISKYSKSTQGQQQSSNKCTSSPSHIPVQLDHNTLDTTSWPMTKSMAPLPSNTQTKKKNLDQFFNYPESSKQRMISTVMPNCHTKQHKAHKKNIIPHMPLLCRTKRLILNIVIQSWLQDLKNCDTTEYNQHQLEHDHSQQSKRITTIQSLPLHQKRPKPWYHCSHTYAQKINIPP
jgi:hypothetical protein